MCIRQTAKGIWKQMSENDLSPTAHRCQHRVLYVNPDTHVESWFLKLIDQYLEWLRTLGNRVYYKLASKRRPDTLLDSQFGTQPILPPRPGYKTDTLGSSSRAVRAVLDELSLGAGCPSEPFNPNNNYSSSTSEVSAMVERQTSHL